MRSMKKMNRFLVEHVGEGDGAAYDAWRKAEARAVPKGRFPLLLIQGPNREKGRLVVVHESDLNLLAGCAGEAIGA